MHSNVVTLPIASIHGTLHFYSVCYITISSLNLSQVGHLTYLSDVPLILEAIKSLIVEPIKRSARVSRG
jgi:hypothetical protein